MSRRALVFATLLLWAVVTLPGHGAERFITVGSTTSTQNSGLYEYLLPKFTAASGIEVRVIAVGTGKALRMAEAGDVDLLIVHHTPSELAFVKEGYGLSRTDLMVNDFVIVGPADDPAAVADADSVADALRRISSSGALFVSRGDQSGTHLKEQALWEQSEYQPQAASDPWYRETGSGMGATLNVASALGGYLLSDRATWLKFGNKGDLGLLYQGDTALLNQYGVVEINGQRHPHIKSDDARNFRRWLLSPDGQAAIDSYRIEGKQAFFGNAERKQAD